MTSTWYAHHRPFHQPVRFREPNTCSVALATKANRFCGKLFQKSSAGVTVDRKRRILLVWVPVIKDRAGAAGENRTDNPGLKTCISAGPLRASSLQPIPYGQGPGGVCPQSAGDCQKRGDLRERGLRQNEQATIRRATCRPAANRSRPRDHHFGYFCQRVKS